MSEETSESLPMVWEEREGNTKYEISIQTSKEEPWLIKEMELRTTEYHNGNYISDVIILKNNHGDYYLERYKTRFNWNGTGRDNVLTLSFNDYSPELLRIFYYDEIYENVQTYGVKKTIEVIKSFVVDVIAVGLFDNKVCELEETY